MPPPFQSAILRGNGPNARLEQAASRQPSVKKGPPADDPEAIKRIQRALVKLLNRPMPESFPNGPDGEPDGSFGQETFDAVVAFQKKVFPGQPNEHDGRVGIKTLEKMDALLPKGGGGGGPTPPPPPVVGAAGVAVGPVGARSSIINDYYNFCGLETIHFGRQVTTSPPRPFASLEQLIDQLLVRPEFHQVVVCHGNPSDGLLTPLAPGAAFRRTGQVIGDLSALADREEQGIAPSTPVSQSSIKFVVKTANVTQSTVLRIVHKLVLLRRVRRAMHLRACNIDTEVARNYGSAFGSPVLSFHSCRLLFLRIVPRPFDPGFTAAFFKTRPSTPPFRIRVFEDPFGEISSMAVRVIDKDGHENVESLTGIDRFSTGDVKGWAEAFVRKWTKANPTEFVVPVMWDNHELTFHLPLEESWSSKLSFIV